MPIYEYRCGACGEEFSRRESFSEHESSRPTCPGCGSDRVQQIFRSVSVQTSKKS